MLNNSDEENTSPPPLRIEGLSLEIGGLRLTLQAVEVTGGDPSASDPTSPAALMVSTPLAQTQETAAPPPLHAEEAHPLRPLIPPVIARRLSYLWILSFRLDSVLSLVEAFDPALSDKLRSNSPGVLQQHKPAFEGIYAIEQGWGTGEKKVLRQPYNSIYRNITGYFEDEGFMEMPRGLYGWRHFFIERGWNETPPPWMHAHLPEQD